MAVKVAINGFGRIGRMILRAWLESGRKDLEIVAINDLAEMETSLHLLKYDSVHGILNQDISFQGDKIIIGKKEVFLMSEADPKKLNWKKQNIDIVFECTGRFTSKESASVHLKGGAKKVLISAPGTEVDNTIVYGVNHETLKPSHTVVSNASCTTNCMAPVAMVLDNFFGIESGFMTTIHAYTSDQRLIDTAHKDLRRARAAGLSMIPTSTGAGRSVGEVLPQLKGKLDGTAVRVPVPNVSMVDFVFSSKKPLTIAEINNAVSGAADGKLKGVLQVESKPLVSTDFNHNPHSSIFDLTQTNIVGDKMGRVVAWYDNEWGFSNRMMDTAVYMMAL
jgi:glyceraldehyde 3-phosphate dehydrogenase